MRDCDGGGVSEEIMREREGQHCGANDTRSVRGGEA